MNNKILFIRSQDMDPRMIKNINSSLSNGYNVKCLLWNRRGLNARKEKSDFEINYMNIKVAPGSIKVVYLLVLWWFFVIYKTLKDNYDLIHVSDFDSYLPVLIIAKIFRKPVIYDIYDFYAEMISFPIFPKLFSILIARIDRYLMRYADLVIIADDSRIEQIGNISNKNIISIYNSFDENVLKNLDLNTKETKKNKFTIFFGGGVSEDRSIDKVLLAVKDLKDVELIVMGPCDIKYKNQLLDMGKNISNVKIYLNRFSYEQIIEQTIKADLLFTLYNTSVPNNKYSSPNKLFEAMALGKPIIVNKGTSMENIVKKCRCGLCIKCCDPLVIRNSIIYLKENPQLMKKMSDNGIKNYQEKYSWKIMEKKLLDNYNKILR